MTFIVEFLVYNLNNSRFLKEWPSLLYRIDSIIEETLDLHPIFTKIKVYKRFSNASVALRNVFDVVFTEKVRYPVQTVVCHPTALYLNILSYEPTSAL